MRRLKREAAVFSLVIVLALGGLSGCSGPGKPTNLPGPDPLCGVFNSAQIADMLPSGDYQAWPDPPQANSVQGRIWFMPDGVWADGTCTIYRSDQEYGLLSVDVSVSTYLPEARAKSCHEGELSNLHTPRVGALFSSGYCAEKVSGQPREVVWALYWGGGYDNASYQLVTMIDVSLEGRKGQDQVADGTAVVQMVLDFIDRSYAGDPSAFVTWPPVATPTPGTLRTDGPTPTMSPR
jgi:hypothetical protein